MKYSTVLSRLFCALLILAGTSFIHAEERAPQSEKHTVSADLWVYNYSYLSFDLDIGYRSPALFKALDIRAAATLKSYGLALFKLQPGIQEIQAAAEWYSPASRWGSFGLAYYALAGGTLWFSTRSSEFVAQPIIGGGLCLDWHGLELRLPVWLRLYSDGFSLNTVPQLGYRLGSFLIRANFELIALSNYLFTNSDLRGRMGLGVAFSL